MKKLVVFLCAMLLFLGVVGIANAKIIKIEFGFTITHTTGYPLEVGDKGTGWFTYDDELPGIIYDYEEPHHDTGYYQGIVHVATADYEMYSGDAEILMLNNYFGTDEFELRSQKIVGENDTRIDLSFAGPSDLWDSLPLTLPILDFDWFTYLHGYMWNYNLAHGGIQDKVVYFEYDYINYTNSVPEPATIILTKVKIKFKDEPVTDEFEVKGTFVLGEDSDGIDLFNEPVEASVDSFIVVIPANSFIEEIPGEYKFKGTTDSIEVDAKIKEIDTETFEFKVKAKGFDLTGTTNVVNVKLLVGDDAGTADVRLTGDLKFDMKKHK